MFLIFREAPAAFPESFELSAEEYRHLRARRLQSGATVQVGDGRGRRLAYRLAYEQGAGVARVQRGDGQIEHGNEAPIELFTAVPEGKRWDWLLQKATELGATAIHPIETAYSEARKLKREREERIILEAAVQSRRYILPALGDEVSLALDLQGAAGRSDDSAGRGAQKFAAPEPIRVALDPRGDRSFAQYLRAAGAGDPDAGFAGKPFAIFVGPEGGFSELELTRFAEAGTAVCRLGSTVLRVETAALAALACLNAG
ncbi:MAG: 16S rRNA (uracil(1498)-N(3))-methyltransferase [bacterium]|nr:16S rRNA (uracil(1498)-N(3))-methyltransferase [bacterium]